MLKCLGLIQKIIHFYFCHIRIINLVEQRVSILIAGLLVTMSVYLGDVLHFIPVAALYGMFIYLGLNGLRGLDSVNTVLALITRRKYWSRWEFLTNLPIPQLAVIVSINFAELGILMVFIILAEFTTAGFLTLSTPLIFLFSGILREFILPKWKWLAPCLAKVGIFKNLKNFRNPNIYIQCQLRKFCDY